MYLQVNGTYSKIMKHLLLTTIAAVVLVGCGESQPPEPPTAKAPDISIHKAAIIGNTEAIQQHLAAGTDVDAKNGYEWTPLHRAASGGHKETAELLIAEGADVNAKDEDGDTPLVYAEGEKADILRKHGAKEGDELNDELKAEGIKFVASLSVIIILLLLL